MPSYAVATGLMGIDGVHSGGISEPHPLFSLAVRLPGDVFTATAKTEQWAFFIRNRGDEGNCRSQIDTFEPEAGGRDYYISGPWADDFGRPSPVSVVPRSSQ